MNLQRIDDYINAYAKAIGMPEEYIEYVKELMKRRIEKYEKIYPYITTKEDDYDKYIIKPKNGIYTTEDFLLNRLMRNVWYVESGPQTEGQYNMDGMSISFNKEKIEQTLKERFPDNYIQSEEMKNIARKKIISHELGHALQTSYTKSALNNIHKSIYKKIIEEIQKINNGQYRSEINTYEQINKIKFGKIEHFIHSGILYATDVSNVRNYREVNGIVDLNEIFNETESLETVDAKIQGKKYYRNDTYYNIRNGESSNCDITNYGDIIKMLLGDKLTFVGMYINPSILYQIFNKRYRRIFQEEFESNKTPIEILSNSIKKIKETQSYEERIKLETALTKCFERRIKKQIGQADPITLQSRVEYFRTMVLNSENAIIRHSLEHLNILDFLQRDIIQSDLER